MKPHQAAQRQPLVVHFTCDRYDLLSMVLPRVINATRKVGGYLWVIDDFSYDTRVVPLLEKYWAAGYIDHVTYGKRRRFIDWTEAEDKAWGGPCARNSVAIRYLAMRGAPFAIFIHADMIVSEDAFLTLLTGARVAREEGIPASTYCGFRMDPVLFAQPRLIKQGYEFRLLGQYNSLQLNLTPFDTVRRLESEALSRFPGRWSMNYVGLRAYEELGLEACYVMDVKAQHLGVNIQGRTWTDDATMCQESPIALEENGGFLQIPGFDVDHFMKASKQSCFQVFMMAHWDSQTVKIIEKQPIHPEFFKLRELIP